MKLLLLLPFSWFLVFSASISAAQQVDAAAQALIARSHAAFSGGKPVTSVTMSGTASWHYGSDEQTGTVQLSANADGSSRMELHLEKGTRIETQSAFNADPHCTWTGFDEVEHEAALHNCWVSTVWFLPQITLQAGAGAKESVVVANGNRLRQTRPPHGMQQRSAELFTKATASDVELDAQTGLLSSLSFNAHPDNDALTEIATEIRYSDYHEVDGASVPFKIQKYVNHGLVLELDISSATVAFGP
jgi:hypothetical protein